MNNPNMSRKGNKSHALKNNGKGLTKAVVKAIRKSRLKDASPEKRNEIMAKHDISLSHYYRIVNREVYKDVD